MVDRPEFPLIRFLYKSDDINCNVTRHNTVFLEKSSLHVRPPSSFLPPPSMLGTPPPAILGSPPPAMLGSPPPGLPPSQIITNSDINVLQNDVSTINIISMSILSIVAVHFLLYVFSKICGNTRFTFYNRPKVASTSNTQSSENNVQRTVTNRGGVSVREIELIRQRNRT